MAVTRSWTMAGPAPVIIPVQRRRSSHILAWLMASSLLVAAGVWFVYQAKLQRISENPVVNLNSVTSPEQ